MKKLKANILKDGSWRKVAADRVLQGAGTQPLHTHLYRRQATVVEWVALPPIFKVCARDTGYEGWGKLQEPWWRKAAEEKQPRVTLEQISAVARERRQQAYRRHGGGEGREEKVTGNNR